MTSLMVKIFLGLIMGLGFGYALQRGRYCVNTAFRDITLIKDSTLLRAWALGLVVQMVGVNLLATFGVLTLDRAPFFWMANIVGGFLFGIGMVLAGGCASGTCYRTGEGMLGSMIAFLGFGIATVATDVGFLSPIQRYLRETTLQVRGETPDLANLFGVNPWIIIVVVVIPVTLWLVRASRSQYRSSGWQWQTTGLIIGAISVIAWLSSTATGRNYGLSVTGPIRSLFRYLFEGDVAFLDWGTFMLIGLLIGAGIGAYLYGESKLRLPKPSRILQSLGGGLLMGFGAQVAGGCTIGHSFTGLSVLAVSSLMTTIFIVLGAWTMVYFLFMRPAEVQARVPERKSVLELEA
ncbi:MAG: YeeE/YedE family protein [Candidatus Bipolaricaulia bacterium]